MWTQTVVLLRIVHKQRPQGATTNQMYDIPVKQQTQDVYWPQSEEPPQDLQQQDLSRS